MDNRDTTRPKDMAPVMRARLAQLKALLDAHPDPMSTSFFELAQEECAIVRALRPRLTPANNP